MLAIVAKWVAKIQLGDDDMQIEEKIKSLGLVLSPPPAPAHTGTLSSADDGLMHCSPAPSAHT